MKVVIVPLLIDLPGASAPGNLMILRIVQDWRWVLGRGDHHSDGCSAVPPARFTHSILEMSSFSLGQ
jgi:hypothetical protein